MKLQHALATLLVAVPLALYGCGGAPASTDDNQSEEKQEQVESQDAQATDEDETDSKKDSKKESSKKDSDEDDRLDLLVLVNKENALPDGWEDKIELEGDTNIKGDYIEVDKIAFDAFNDLKDDLEENEGITIELNSGYRSIAEQQRIWDELLEENGEDYVKEFVAVPGYSEHQTGLALDALLVEDGVPIVTNEDIYARQETWDIIHSYLAKHGFILRYLDGMEDITGYTYEPWHIRYVGKKAATEIMNEGITLEEYLDEA